MIEKIAMWGGFAGIIVALFAIIILFLTRKNILDILDKDVILFDKNFELKEQAIESALHLVDDLEANESLKLDPVFVSQAKACYNKLVCVATDVRLAEDFYDITLSQTKLDRRDIPDFKLACRRDIGLNVKHSKAIKNFPATKQNRVIPPQPIPQHTEPAAPPVQAQATVQPTVQAQPAKPVRPIIRRTTTPKDGK